MLRRNLGILLADHAYISAYRKRPYGKIVVFSLPFENRRTEAHRKFDYTHPEASRGEVMPELVDNDQDSEHKNRN